MKRRKKQFKKTTASRNALTTKEPKKRFGKKQKRKLIIIGVLVLIFCVGFSYFVRGVQIKKAEAEEKARHGKLIEKNADKKPLDEEGNEIIDHKSTEIHVINVGDGCATLIKKGHYEVLVDAGSESVTEYLSKHVDGDLEYFITTNCFDENIKGMDAVNKNFTVSNYIYNNMVSDIGEEANWQVIDMDENLSVTVKPGIEGDDFDKSAVVLVSDGDQKIAIVGNASAKNIKTLTNEDPNGMLAYIAGGTPNVTNTPLVNLKALKPQNIIVSTKTKLSQDFIENASKANASLYATYKSKNIIIKIESGLASMNVTVDDTLQRELENSQTEQTEQPSEDASEE